MRIRGGDPSTLRRINLAAMLRALYEDGSQTVTEIATATRLSRPTCEEGVNDLLVQGRIAEAPPSDPANRAPGRPAKRYAFNAAAGRVLGVDIGAHKALAMTADLAGHVTSEHRVQLDPDLAPPDRLAAIRQAVLACLAADPTPGEPGLLAVVAGSPGVIDAEGRVLLCNVMPGWTGVHLSAELARMLEDVGVKTDGPVRVENDMSMAALAEQWQGVAKGIAAVVYIHAGHRLGAGVLIDGKPYRGHHGAAGEIGTLKLLDWESSYRRLMDYSPTSTAGDVTMRIFTDAGDGIHAAAELVDRFAFDLATGVAAMSMTIDPALVVVGGGISRADEAITAPVRRHLADLCLFPPRVEASALGEESVALGAVRAALLHVEQRLFNPSSTAR
ncbi:ROK family transcriptional regulator [Streptomyces sp. NBC_00873]|uniref:ROK family transcriptional regulator n=1 Tax=unclassified Streptomyces TaxID=2593676 RepID=UPI0038704473|nr:ROK family transcriptional regulator [Streptomyces sp. NBC_00873]WTA42249.1 ROK family transcriptional regulator [Streptomyces sp. NBC_00842]